MKDIEAERQSCSLYFRFFVQKSPLPYRCAR